MAASASNSVPIHAAGLAEVVDGYDTLLLDQFGVLHDGRNAYAHALDAVQRLSQAGKTLVVLSNSGRRSDETVRKLERLGFDRSHFFGAVTSGETTHEALLSRNEPLFAGLGRRCLSVNWADRGATPVDASLYGLELVQDVEQADFILAHGMEALSGQNGSKKVSLEELQALLRAAAARSLPLVIANPDVVTVDKAFLVPMPGQLGVWYGEMANHGDIVLMGKPSRRIYDAAARLVGPQVGRMLAVGDSLAHDVKGAVAAGIDSVFILSGIHADECRPGDNESLRKLAQEHCDGHMPTYVMEHFRW
jgi:HAD superfamily hydrolase (TIGR01459 family)